MENLYYAQVKLESKFDRPSARSCSASETEAINICRRSSEFGGGRGSSLIFAWISRNFSFDASEFESDEFPFFSLA